MNVKIKSPKPRLTWRDRLNRWDVKASPYIYIAPFFLLFCITGLFPILYTGYVSLHDWDLIGGQGEWIGLGNYQAVLGAQGFAKALRNTFSIFLLSSVPQVIMAIFLAYMLDANLRAKTFWRMGVLVPYVVAPVAVGLIFAKLFAQDSGLINAILGTVGIDQIGWQSSVFPAHLAISIMVNFRWTGYNTLIFLAAMQAIPRDVYEAAIVDGVNRVQRFFRITVPMLRPTIIFVVITSTIGGLQIFDEPRMYDTSGLGGADRQWMTMTMYVYELGWGPRRDFGQASAVAWLLFLIIIAFGIVNFMITRRIASTGGPKPTRSERRVIRAREKELAQKGTNR